jgi:hypothetical protein
MFLEGVAQIVTNHNSIPKAAAPVFPLHGVSGLTRIVAPGIHGNLTACYDEQIAVGHKPPARGFPRSIAGPSCCHCDARSAHPFPILRHSSTELAIVVSLPFDKNGAQPQTSTISRQSCVRSIRVSSVFVPCCCLLSQIKTHQLNERKKAK